MSYSETIKTEVLKMIQKETKGDPTAQDMFELAAFFSRMTTVYMYAYQRLEPEGYELLKETVMKSRVMA